MWGRAHDVHRLLSQIMTLYDRNLYQHCRSSTICLTSCRSKYDYASRKEGEKKQLNISEEGNVDFFGILENEAHYHDDQSIPLSKSSKLDYLVEKRKKKHRNILDTEFGHVRYDRKIPDGNESPDGNKAAASIVGSISMNEGKEAAKENQKSEKPIGKAKDFSAGQHKEKNKAGKQNCDKKDNRLAVSSVDMLHEGIKSQCKDFHQSASESQSTMESSGTRPHAFKSFPKVDKNAHKNIKTAQRYSEEISSEIDGGNFFDEQYFQCDGRHSTTPEENQKEIIKTINEQGLHSNSKNVSSEKDKLNYFDEQYFSHEGQFSNQGQFSKVEDSRHSVTTKPQPKSVSAFQNFADDFQISGPMKDDFQISSTVERESECFPSQEQVENTIDDQYFQRKSLHSLVEHKYDSAVLVEKDGLKSDLKNTLTRHTEENLFEEVYFSKPILPISDERRLDCGQEIQHMGDDFEVSKSWEKLNVRSQSHKQQLKTGEEVKNVERDKKIGYEAKVVDEDKKGVESAENTNHKVRNIKKEKYDKSKNLIEDKKIKVDDREERKVNEPGRDVKSSTKDKIELEELEVLEKGKKSKSQKKENKDSKSTENETLSAHAVAMEIRNKMQKNTQLNPSAKNMYTLDSKGFRILKGQVRDLNNMPSSEVLELLYRNIIYNENDIVAINKPYGLPSHGGPGVEISVGQLLPSLAEKLDKKLEMLHLIHRLDKEATGVMLLARTPEMAWRMNGAFRKREVIKKYWAITKNVPKPSEGIINIPMAEGVVQGKTRMVLRPDYGEQRELLKMKNYQPKYEAVTRYRVRDSHGSAALVECIPETGIKHQIRVHLAFGLNTPILGDHKYSHFEKLAPQKLPPDILHRLKVQQSKVRYVPMHLHAVSVMIPEFLDGKNFYVSATLPMHFVRNLSNLKLKINPL